MSEILDDLLGTLEEELREFVDSERERIETERDFLRHVLDGRTGQPVWERKLPVGRGPWTLLPVGRAVVAVDLTGAATLVGSDGQIEWRVGSAGEELPNAIAPRPMLAVQPLPPGPMPMSRMSSFVVVTKRTSR